MPVLFVMVSYVPLENREWMSKLAGDWDTESGIRVFPATSDWCNFLWYLDCDWLPLWLWFSSVYAHLFHANPLYQGLPFPFSHTPIMRNYSSERCCRLKCIPCSLPRFPRPLLFHVLPRKDCLPHLSPLQKSPNDSGYFKGYNVVTVTEWYGISTMTPLAGPLGLFMSLGWLLLCPHWAGWAQDWGNVFSVWEEKLLGTAWRLLFVTLWTWYVVSSCLAPGPKAADTEALHDIKFTGMFWMLQMNQLWIDYVSVFMWIYETGDQMNQKEMFLGRIGRCQRWDDNGRGR